MRGRFTIRTQAALALALAGLPALAHAQSLNNWSLPEPEASSSADRPQGPVDPQNPMVLPAKPTGGPAATPSSSAEPTPVPVITPPPVPHASASAPPAARPSLNPAAQASPHPAAATPSPTVSEATTVPEAAAPEQQNPIAAESGIATSPALETSGTGWPVWWWAIPAGIAILALGLLLFLRRRPRPAEWENEWEEETLPQTEAQAAAPASTPEPEIAPVPAAAVPLRPLPTPNFTPPTQSAPSQPDISIAFEPVAVRLSLFYATLQYRFSLIATEAHGPLKVLGDLIAAHASLSQDEQLAPPPGSLALLHALPGLAPGEALQLKGEVQLPLSAILALHRGGASFFVPLMRICLIGEDGTALRRVFTLGIPGSEQGLAPLRMDTGPRSFEPLAAREIEAARQFPLQTGTLPLDPQRAAG